MRRRGGKEEEEEEEEGVIVKVVVVGWIDWRGKPRTKKKGCDDDAFNRDFCARMMKRIFSIKTARL